MKRIFAIVIAAFFISGSASAETTYPKLKEGEWTVTTELPNIGQPMTVTHCISKENQEKLFGGDQTKGLCDEPKVTNSGNTWTTILNCTVQGKSTTMKMETTFVNDTRFTSRMTTSQQAGGFSSEGKYKGPCGEGSSSTTIQIGSGMKMDAKQLAEMAKAVKEQRGR